MNKFVGILTNCIVLFCISSNRVHAAETKIEGSTGTVNFESNESQEVIDQTLNQFMIENPDLESLQVKIKTESLGVAKTRRTNKKAGKDPLYKIDGIVNKEDILGKRMESYVLSPESSVSGTTSGSSRPSITATYGMDAKLISSQIGMKVTGSTKLFQTLSMNTPYKIGNKMVISGVHDIYARMKTVKFNIWKLENKNYVYMGSPLAISPVGFVQISTYTFE